MTGVGRRIRELRAETQKEPDEIAALVGVSPMSYFDLELHDDELESVPSLANVQRLAHMLGVPSWKLFPEFKSAPADPISYAELVASVERHLSGTSSTREQFEELVGWDLGNFFAGEPLILENYLCEPLNIAWERALP